MCLLNIFKVFIDFRNPGINLFQSSKLHLCRSRGNKSDVLRSDIIVSEASGMKVRNSFEDLDYDIHNLLFRMHFSSTDLAYNVKSFKAFSGDVHVLSVLIELIVLLDLRMMQLPDYVYTALKSLSLKLSHLPLHNCPLMTALSVNCLCREPV